MKTIIIWFITFWMGVSLLPEAKAAKRFQTGEPLPSFSLPMPENPDQKAYLGLSGKNTFGISQINASIVIIEIFSMYCPHCQREAPLVNRLYERIQRSPELKEKVKLIGIGVGNSPFEVNVFRKRYKIPFPLFPDGDFLAPQAFRRSANPFFYGRQAQ